MALSSEGLDTLPPLVCGEMFSTVDQVDDCDYVVVTLFDELGSRLMLYVL